MKEPPPPLLPQFGRPQPAYVEHGFLPAGSDAERIPLIRAGTAEAAAALAGDEEAKPGDEEKEELTGAQGARCGVSQ